MICAFAAGRHYLLVCLLENTSDSMLVKNTRHGLDSLQRLLQAAVLKSQHFFCTYVLCPYPVLRMQLIQLL